MNLVRDPMCGMQIDPKATSARTEYEGAVYYFCSKDCLKLFKAYVEQFVKIAGDAKGRSRE